MKRRKIISACDHAIKVRIRIDIETAKHCFTLGETNKIINLLSDKAIMSVSDTWGCNFPLAEIKSI